MGACVRFLGIVVVTVAIGVGLILRKYRSHGSDTVAEPTACSASSVRFFSESYDEARNRFRHLAHAASLQTVPVALPGFEDLTVDFLVVPGSEEGLLIHISGTHGVEGFAGSAIQTSLLTDLVKAQSSESTRWGAAQGRPTVLFVHALNAFGMRHSRRWNENSVDLNRNGLTEAQRKELLARSPNELGYEDVSNVLNPSKPVQFDAFDWVVLLTAALRYSKEKLQIASVSGQYHNSKGLFFGGRELQPSLHALERFLTENISVASVRRAVTIDVHTGLGVRGVDSVLVTSEKELANGRDMYSTTLPALLQNLKAKQGVLGTMYNKQYGSVKTFIKHILQRANPDVDVLASVTQEFGTADPISVLRALRAENADFHYGQPQRTRRGRQVRDVFYCSDSCAWKTNVVSRGSELFYQSLNRLRRE